MNNRFIILALLVLTIVGCGRRYQRATIRSNAQCLAVCDRLFTNCTIAIGSNGKPRCHR